MQLPNSGTYDQIKILTSKDQASGFLDTYKYIPFYMYRNSIFQMPKCLRRGNARIIQFIPGQKFCESISIKKLMLMIWLLSMIYQLIQYLLGKKHADKYLQKAGQISGKRKQNITSPYKDVKLALLHWLKGKRSRDVPPPLTKEILRAKANRFVPFFN